MKTLQPIRRCERLLLAFACVWLAAFTAGTAHSQLVLTDLGMAAPTPGPYDISQLLTTGDTAPYTTDGINYYDNNSGDSAPGSSGQTFTTDSLTEGYVLTNLVIKFGGWNPKGNDFNGNPQGWRIEIFQLEDANSFASLIYSNQTSGADLNHGPQDWLQFSGMAVQLSPNTTYAYTIINTTNTSNSSDDLGYAKMTPYTGGAVCRILSVGGSVVYYSSDNISAAFDAASPPSGRLMPTSPPSRHRPFPWAHPPRSASPPWVPLRCIINGKPMAAAALPSPTSPAPPAQTSTSPRLSAARFNSTSSSPTVSVVSPARRSR